MPEVAEDVLATEAEVGRPSVWAKLLHLQTSDHDFQVDCSMVSSGVIHAGGLGGSNHSVGLWNLVLTWEWGVAWNLGVVEIVLVREQGMVKVEMNVAGIVVAFDHRILVGISSSLNPQSNSNLL